MNETPIQFIRDSVGANWMARMTEWDDGFQVAFVNRRHRNQMVVSGWHRVELDAWQEAAKMLRELIAKLAEEKTA